MSLPNSSKGPVDKHTSSERGNFEKHSKTKIQIFMGEKKIQSQWILTEMSVKYLDA